MGMTTLCQEVFKAPKEPNRPRSRRRPRPRKFVVRYRLCGQNNRAVHVPKGLMKVARHGVPGTVKKKAPRPGGTV